MTWKPDVCIHHHPCNDGFAAAWVVKQKWPDVECIGRNYGQPAPDVAGKDVLIVDFSYNPDVLGRMHAKSIVVLDHHKTAEADLADFRIELCGGAKFVPEDLGHTWRDLAELNRPSIVALFDMNRCGAALAWDFCFPGSPVSDLVKWIQDRDLWKWQYPETRAVDLYLRSFPYTFEAWDGVMQKARQDLPGLLAEATGLERLRDQELASILEGVRFTRFDDRIDSDIPIVNAPPFLASDLGHRMLGIYPNAPYAVIWWESFNGRIYSLRARKGETDVSEIAKSFGGGGHAAAAGFRVPRL